MSRVQSHSNLLCVKVWLDKPARTDPQGPRQAMACKQSHGLQAITSQSSQRLWTMALASKF
jgi:hypothetical protein